MLLKNQQLQDKLAVSINKALQQETNSHVSQETVPTTHSSQVQGESIATTSTSNVTHDETVSSIVKETENDPAFAEFMEQYMELFIGIYNYYKTNMFRYFLIYFTKF